MHLMCIILVLSSISSESVIFDAFDPIGRRSETLVGALDNIINRFYKKETSTVFIMLRSSLSVRNGSSPEEIAGKIIRNKRVQLNTLSYVMGNHIKSNHTIYHPFYNIILVDSYDSFRQIFSGMTTNGYDYNGFYTIIVSEYSEDLEDIILMISKDCWSFYIVNVVILVPDESYNNVIVYTYFPYEADHCEHIEPVIHDKFENGQFVLNATIFPDKLRNFHLCPLRPALFSFPPYMEFGNSSNGSIFIGGIEGNLLLDLSRTLNFTPVVIPSGRNAPGLKQDLKPSLEMVQDGIANFSIGANTVRPKRYTQFSISNAYLYPSYLFAIPPGKSYTSLEKLYFPFRVIIWYFILCLFIVGTLVIVVLKSVSSKLRNCLIGGSNDMPFFNMFNICLGGAVQTYHIPVGSVARAVLLIWIVATLVLRNSYQGKLFDYLRGNQRRAPYFFLEELFESNLQLYLMKSYINDIANAYPQHKHRMDTYNALPENFRNLSKDNFNGAYMTLSQLIDYYNFLHFPDVHILKTKQYFRLTMMAIHHRRYSCLLDTFNNQIDGYLSGGIVEFWGKSYKKEVRYDADQMEPKPLSLNQINGIIFISSLLFFVCMILFIFELISKSNRTVKIVFDFLTYGTKQKDS